MTPFMLQVAELVGSPLDEELPVPDTVPALARPAGEGADRQVVLRAQAEQLVCEANAVLTDAEDHLALTDELVEGQLAFTVHYRGRAAHVATRFADGHAFARLSGDGVPDDEPRELAGPDALPDLILLLLIESDLPRHPAEH